ncbi:uncharacterized protein LOC118742880 [Rhagoletis pomonella]|uniref:uncharacterized protein LOC118742880 n=1 Tax=Rhagoletis pomonella TaxID=28610 RepID=UPI00177BF680|nr:uncharacterized protein LOC118742880 [Rhagoletis pomonella]
MRSGRKHKKNFKRSGSNYLSNSVTSPVASSHTTLRNKSRGKRKIRNPFKRRLSKKQSKILSKKLRGNHGDSMDSSESSPDVTVIEATSVPMPKVDETPVIRNKLKSVVFKKFRDNTERRLDLRKKRLNRKSFDGDTTSDSQRITKKLLRSIKRRHLQNPYNLMQVQRENMLKRRLHLTNTSTKVLKPTISHNVTIEEGEIISDDEVNHSQTKKALNTKPSGTSAVETDDDCICIEPQIEQIVIDDDLPETSRSKRKNNISSGYVSLLQGINDRDSKLTNKLVTSTPYGEGSKRPAVRNSTQCNENDIGDLTGLFYEDVSIINPLETIISEDTFTNYTKMSTLVGEERKAKKKKRIGNKSQKQSADISKDFLTLDETLKLANPNEEENEKEVTQTDDSVIFISETVVRSDKPAPMMDYVPLSSNDVPNPIFVPKSPPRPPRLAAIKSGLFTNSEKKQLDAYNDNTYNPNADDPKAREKRTSKRLVLIDGCNVAFNHSLNREFSVKGLKICIEFFEKLGHEVKAVLPQFRMHRCSDSAAMTELRNAGKIVVTPCKNLPGMFSSSYDDRFILQLAAEMDAVIVSNDNYRDLINENRAFKKLIENRVIGFTWCNDLFMVAKDPYGKWGPPLHIILNRT